MTNAHTTFKSGLSPQLIMRASLARHLKELKPEDIQSRWNSPEEQKRSGENEIENLGWTNEYAEPGYQSEPRGILTADWNYFTRDITDVLERAGFSCEWSDEWSTCEDCGKLVRTTGNSYEWQPFYVIQNECVLRCLNCGKRGD